MKRMEMVFNTERTRRGKSVFLVLFVPEGKFFSLLGVVLHTAGIAKRCQKYVCFAFPWGGHHTCTFSGKSPLSLLRQAFPEIGAGPGATQFPQIALPPAHIRLAHTTQEMNGGPTRTRGTVNNAGVDEIFLTQAGNDKVREVYSLAFENRCRPPLPSINKDM